KAPQKRREVHHVLSFSAHCMKLLLFRKFPRFSRSWTKGGQNWRLRLTPAILTLTLLFQMHQ
ncbi:MAG: hypothetical protein MUE38_08240, partial [Flavihumibacter sp.]|nr:hypothetical protein [Flavihumibacter sp.]